MKKLLLITIFTFATMVQAGMPTRARPKPTPALTAEQKATAAAEYKAAQAAYQASHPPTPAPVIPLAPVTVCSYC